MSEEKPVRVDVYRHGELEVDKELGNEISVENKDEILITGESREDVYQMTGILKKALGGEVYSGETAGVPYGIIVTDISKKQGEGDIGDIRVEDVVKHYVGALGKVKVRGKEQLGDAIKRAGKE